MVTEITELHVFDYGDSVRVWTLFLADAGTYREGHFEALADGDELLRFCSVHSTQDAAAVVVRSMVDLSHKLGEHVTVFRHKR